MTLDTTNPSVDPIHPAEQDVLDEINISCAANYTSYLFSKAKYEASTLPSPDRKISKKKVSFAHEPQVQIIDTPQVQLEKQHLLNL